MENNKHSGNNDQKSNATAYSGSIYDSKPTSADELDALRTFRYRSFRCPCCRTDISVTKADVGKSVVCPDCDTEVVVPNYLDFDAETDYERQFYNKSKKQQDEKYSPLRNPNRIGIRLDGNNVYALRDSDDLSFKGSDREVFYPVRCRICETLISAPSSMLGQRVTCPDCGTETVVTDVLKRQQDAVDVKFQPRDRGIYSIGDIPNQPVIAFQRQNGKTVLIDPRIKSIAPKQEPTTDARVKYVEESDNPRIRAETFDSNDALETNVRQRQARRSTTKLPRITQPSLIERWNEKRRQKLEEREDSAKFLPPMVLRRRDGEFVWALPSPPKILPLFNKSFRPVFSEDIWTRGLLLTFIIGLVACLTSLFVIPITEKKIVPGDFATASDKALLIGVFGIAIPAILSLITLLEVYFVSIYNAGNCGAKRVVEWQSEDFFGYLGKGVWFSGILLLSFAPGGILGGCLSEETTPFLKSAFFWGSFWFLFPIFWLSTSQTDWLFCPISWGVFSSFFSKFHVPSVLWGALAWNNVFFCVSPFVIILGTMFYGLLLGRLSWILEDEIRNMDYDD